jgi:hypothetical protein
MDNTSGAQTSTLHSLIPLADFKALLGIDDREDKISTFCLITATYSIEHYCLRRLFLKRHFDCIEYAGDLLLPLREYPVREVLGIWGVGNREWGAGGALIEPEFYQVIPDLEEGAVDLPYSLALSPTLLRGRRLGAVKAVYRAGYACGEVPPDLASACMELAAWNMSRYRGRRIGITGNVRGSGKDGEHLETAMPENVRLLLEPYRRRTI